MDASVLIATFNRAALLDETLDSIRQLRVAPGRAWEAIVVDNNSTDRTRAVALPGSKNISAATRRRSSERRAGVLSALRAAAGSSSTVRTTSAALLSSATLSGLMRAARARSGASKIRRGRSSTRNSKPTEL